MIIPYLFNSLSPYLPLAPTLRGWGILIGEKTLIDFDTSYAYLLGRVVRDGDFRIEPRTKSKIYSLFGTSLEVNLDPFPILHGKYIHFKSIKHELLWFLSGSTNVKDLQKYGVKIWDEWADENGELGPIYGKQWRDFGGDGVQIGVNQIKQVINSLKHHPFGRRHIVVAYNPSDIGSMALAPCHALFQFYVSNDRKLFCQMYQRSADIFLGVPFNVTSYALLTHMIAQVCGYGVGKLTISFGDLHLYDNHSVAMNKYLGQLKEMVTEDTDQDLVIAKLWLNKSIKDIDDFTGDDIKLLDYYPKPKIQAPITV